MNLQLATDEDLVAALRQQDVAALEELYDRHHRVALAVANRVLGDMELAQDVLQETFLAVWRQAHTFSADRGRARSWLLSIVRHRAIDVTRGKAYANRAFSLEEMEINPPGPDVVPEVIRNIEGEAVRNAVEQLPDEQRNAISLAYFGGYTNQEIAEMTSTPLGTVKGRIRLGMQKLREMLVLPEEEGSD